MKQSWHRRFWTVALWVLNPARHPRFIETATNPGKRGAHFPGLGQGDVLLALVTGGAFIVDEDLALTAYESVFLAR